MFFSSVIIVQLFVYLIVPVRERGMGNTIARKYSSFHKYIEYAENGYVNCFDITYNKLHSFIGNTKGKFEKLLCFYTYALQIFLSIAHPDTISFL